VTSVQGASAPSYQDQGYSTFGYDGRDRAGYENPESTAKQQPISSFPYEGDPPSRREHGRRRGR
jgi:hypothetical protein